MTIRVIQSLLRLLVKYHQIDNSIIKALRWQVDLISINLVFTLLNYLTLKYLAINSFVLILVKFDLNFIQGIVISIF